MDDASREKFYAPGGDVWGDDGKDYEVEPPDPEVIAEQERLAKENVEAASYLIDIDEIYRDLDGRTDFDAKPGAPSGFRFQFQIKHMLILTAVVAVILAMTQLKLFGAVMALLILCAGVGGFAVLEIQEQRKWAAAHRRVEEKYEKRRRFLESRLRNPLHEPGQAATIYDDLRYDEGDAHFEAGRRPDSSRWRFQFSLKQLLLAMTCMALVFTAVRILGGPQYTAAVLGLLVLVGMVVGALSINPPEILVLAWWIFLLLYVLASLLTLLSMVFGS